MPNKYELKATAGALALERHWQPDPKQRVRAPVGGGGSRAGMPGPSTAGRVSLEWSARSRRNMRFEFLALPWELLGMRPMMLTLTYPGNWQLYVPHSEQLRLQREAFKSRWTRAWGPPIGVWVVEFQRRGAPHLHLYIAIPDAVTDEDYRLLVERTTARRRRELDVGKYKARSRSPVVPGEFGMWLRDAWWAVVGSGLPEHHRRGVDVAVAYFSDQAAEQTNRQRVAAYFWQESGKWRQKQPPEDFGSLRFYGRWGQKQGFNPIVEQSVLEERTGLELRRVMERLRVQRIREDAAKNGWKFNPRKGRARGRDGLRVFDVNGLALAPKLQAWAEALAAEKASAQVPQRRPSHDWDSRKWRALSEIPVAEDGFDAAGRSLADDPYPEPADDADERDWEYEAEQHWERVRRDEELIDAAVEAESERQRLIDIVRMANGLAPRPKKRLRIVDPRTGRTGTPGAGAPRGTGRR